MSLFSCRRPYTREYSMYLYSCTYGYWGYTGIKGIENGKLQRSSRSWGYSMGIRVASAWYLRGMLQDIAQRDGASQELSVVSSFIKRTRSRVSLHSFPKTGIVVGPRVIPKRDPGIMFLYTPGTVPLPLRLQNP